MSHISAVLEAGGASLADVVKVNVFLTTMDDFAGMNEVYDEVFKNTVPRPVSHSPLPIMQEGARESF